MKRLIIIYVNEEEFEQLKKKYPNAQYYESNKYKKLKVSPQREIRCYCDKEELSKKNSV